MSPQLGLDRGSDENTLYANLRCLAAQREALREEISAVVRTRPTADLLDALRAAGLVVSPVHSIADVRELPGVKEHLTSTELPDGRRVRLPPTAVDTERQRFTLSPKYGEHTRTVLEEAGISPEEIGGLFDRGVVR